VHPAPPAQPDPAPARGSVNTIEPCPGTIWQSGFRHGHLAITAPQPASGSAQAEHVGADAVTPRAERVIHRREFGSLASWASAPPVAQQAQNSKICAAAGLPKLESTAVQNGGYTRAGAKRR